MAIQQVDLVGNSGRPVVTPQATEQLAGAFRSGFISADDIMERVSERTRAKQELELVTANQGIADATNPDLIQAKRNQQLAAGAQAGSALKLAPLAEEEQTSRLKAAIYDAKAKPGGFDLMQTALSKAGYPVSVDPNIGLTDANKTEIIKRFAALDIYTLKRADAEDRVKTTKSEFFPTSQTLPDGSTAKGQLQKLFRNGQEITGDDLAASVKEAEALKRTPFSQWYSLRAGRVAAPASAVAPATPAPVTIPPVDGAMIQPRTATTTPITAPLPVIQPAAPAPQLGQTVPGLGIVTSIEAAPTPVPLRPTEGQQRALLAVPRFQEANAALNDLQARGYDPTSWLSWIDSYLPQILKSGDRKEFETAMSVWSQGLLRLESGAAITPKEQSWYEKAFFPIVGDPPTVLKQKEALRHSVEGMVAELGSAGPIDEGLKQRAQGVFRAAETFTKGGSTAATPTSATPPATPSALPLVQSVEDRNRLPAGTTYRLPDGTERRKP